MTRMMHRFTPLVAALLLAACATPAFQAPEVELPSNFKEAAADGKWKPAQPAEAQARGEWWKVFGDARLDALIAEATAANQNLSAAAARVRQSRALAGIAESERIPQVNVQAGAQRGRASAVPLGLPAGTPVPAGNVFQAGLGASYEIDLFGRVAGNVSASQADAAASEATFRSVQLALQADVAQTYFRLLSADAELGLLRETVRLREENVRINQRRFDLGDIGELDLARANTELSTTRSDLLAVERQRAQLEHALAILLGKPPAAFSLETNLLLAAAMPSIPAGLPSALLERRPDIAAAQRAMIAANARIGVAKSAMFPALRLTAAGGGESADLADVFNWTSRTWLLGVAAALPILDGGRNRSNIARSEAALEEAVAAYRQSILAALSEVEDNLVGLRTLAGQSEAIDSAVASSRRSAELADRLYRAGRSSYLDFLDAQRNLASAERAAVQLRGARASTTVALIRSLGGGW
ncbi:efflux transporter outer membrane subunit [Noviherbaspirillum galbum]|uniref:Efflux transporter outer membrane subunit n=1 Tax=Noviherbaspirillum galbum TaxID=2709383 RepID=A0A6B3SNG8_9BURK|nr:efflux transporter outer membrane subunit [Noviherbaspirillum galbum]NEX62420.1 efflux transporter outer membrane subunit [Noviherbaspirillum galbum]